MNEYNDSEIKRIMESKAVPEQLSPDSIKKMLDEKAPAKKRKNIKRTAAKITAAAAACAVICGFGVHYAEQGNLFNKNNNKHSENEYLIEVSSPESASAPKVSYMSSVADYSELYYMLESASERYEAYMRTEICDDAVMQGNVYLGEQTADGADDAVKEYDWGENGASKYDEFYETYNQEEGVLEADVVKTDGKYIYYLCQNYGEASVNIAETDNGSFTGSCVLDISKDIPGLSDNLYVMTNDMYLYNDMLIVITNVDDEVMYGVYDCIGPMGGNTKTYVNVYTTGLDPQLIGTYSQDGSYNDVRITPDGYMYLITDYYSASFSSIDGVEDVKSYVPSYGVNGESRLIAPECILLPCEGDEEYNSIPYSIVGSLDMSEPGAFSEADIKALSGFTGSLYCSGANLYTTSGWDETAITRISLENGIITPAASGTIDGYVKDQFSMSEYNGYFRVAATINKGYDNGLTETWEMETDNCVYVLDMDMNIVSKIDGFGVNETIKSVNFSGDFAYVVTYYQTDPLFSIDLSNPEQPVILDEYKILGYSAYMQQWSDGLLLGFGADANEQGVEQGVKLVMFDNSDPDNLKEAGIYAINPEENCWLCSSAMWERKSLLIAPEKNLIGVPVNIYGNLNGGAYKDICKYMFFSYENGSFTLKGELEADTVNNERAIYIGDYIYYLSDACFISADIETITEYDQVLF